MTCVVKLSLSIVIGSARFPRFFFPSFLKSMLSHPETGASRENNLTGEIFFTWVKFPIASTNDFLSDARRNEAPEKIPGWVNC
jgi:hypothetical protein